MTRGVRKDGKPNSARKNLINERDRTNLKMLNLPSTLLSKPVETMEFGLKLVEQLKLIEEQLTEWEDKQPIEFLDRLPWWPARQEYRRQKALGIVEEVTWWRAASFVEEAAPKRLGADFRHGLYDDPRRRPYKLFKALEAQLQQTKVQAGDKS